MPKCIHVKEREKKKNQQAVPKMFRRKCKWWCFHFKRRKVPKTDFNFFKDSLRNFTYDDLLIIYMTWEPKTWYMCGTAAPDSVQGDLCFHTEVLWRWSLKLYEPFYESLLQPERAFLMDSSTVSQKSDSYYRAAVIWRQFCRDVQSSDLGWDAPPELERFRFNRRAAALGSSHPWEPALAGSRAGRWQEATTKSELQNQQINTLTEVTQGRQQVPPVSAQITPNTWEECGEELRKSLPKPRKHLTAKEPKNQPDHSTVILGLVTLVRLSIHYKVMMYKPRPSFKKFQVVILELAGLNTYSHLSNWCNRAACKCLRPKQI